MQRLTKEQAAIVGAYTGFLSGSFSDMHEYIELKMGRPVWTHEMASKEFMKELKEVTKEDFLSIVHTGEDSHES